jgi:predicted small secreted protein
MRKVLLALVAASALSLGACAAFQDLGNDLVNAASKFAGNVADKAKGAVDASTSASPAEVPSTATPASN